MSPEERLIVQRRIASILDYPSLYMGGPSHGSMRKADNIIKELEQSKRLVPTTCNHSAWNSYKDHGTCCPTCCLNICEGNDHDA